MLDQRRRRWADVVQMLYTMHQCSVLFVGYTSHRLNIGPMLSRTTGPALGLCVLFAGYNSRRFDNKTRIHRKNNTHMQCQCHRYTALQGKGAAVTR